MYEKGRAWIELNMDNLGHNIQLLRGLLPQGCKLMPALKANAYGHGAVPIAKELSKLGMDAFCVATLQEGVELRENHIQGDILILGYTSPEDFDALGQYDLIQTVVDGEYGARLHAWGKPLRVHIKVDTGMHRLGEGYGQTDRFLRLFGYDNLRVEGLYTHLCVADAPEQEAYTQGQLANFYGLVRALETRGISLPKLHIQGSDGLLACPDLRCDYARVGIAMYGALSGAIHPVPLRPVLSLKARVEMVRPLFQGQGLGYGLEFTAPKDMSLAILSIGYGDGIPRQLSGGKGAVLLRGKRAPIIGRICMDKLTVDVTDIPGVAQGDAATLLGKDGQASILVCELASQAGTISNEILSRLGPRLVRVVEGGVAD